MTTLLSGYFVLDLWRGVIVWMLPKLLPSRSAGGVIGARLCCRKRSSIVLLWYPIGLCRRLLKFLAFSSVRCYPDKGRNPQWCKGLQVGIAKSDGRASRQASFAGLSPKWARAQPQQPNQAATETWSCPRSSPDMPLFVAEWSECPFRCPMAPACSSSPPHDWIRDSEPI